MRMYMAGVRDHQLSLGLPWLAPGSERIRRTIRWIKRAFPCSLVGRKFAITVSVLKAILPLLHGWPHLSSMSHADRAFAVASVVGTGCMLRGGEFLTSKAGSRPTLRQSDVVISVVRSVPTLVVSIPQPKANWWVDRVDVPCMGNGTPGDLFEPARLWRGFVAGSPALRRAGIARTPIGDVPAFHLADGTALSRDWLVARTYVLCKAASINLCDHAGSPLPLKSASWRAGGVRSAKDAGLGDTMIMFMGRWTSSAWRSYLLHTPVDMQGAARRFWATTAAGPETAGLLCGVEDVGASSAVIALDASCVSLCEPLAFRGA
jgi:hypothetical protein